MQNIILLIAILCVAVVDVPIANFTENDCQQIDMKYRNVFREK